MGRSTWTGPIVSGPIINTTGTTLGVDVKNTGYNVLSQEVAVTQAGSAAALATNIVIPKGSMIVSIRLYVTAIWSGAAATFNVGTSVTSTELGVAADNTAAALGIVNVSPGANATRTGLWIDTGTSDVRVWLLSTNTGTGTGQLVVQYVQASDVS
jgi:hypothetical protein